MPKLQKSHLKSHLLRSVEILKHSLNYTEYCYFILAILFFSYAAELPTRSYINSGTSPIVPMPHKLPRTLAKRRETGLQDDLIESFSLFEGFNLSLKDVLLPALPSNPLSDSVLTDYANTLDQLHQATSLFSSPDAFSHAYEYWIQQLAMLTVKQGVAFYTQRSLVRLIVEILQPKEGMSIYDPTVGTGGMLIESANFVRRHGGNPHAMRFYGREKESNIWAICKMNMVVHGLQDAVIEHGDTLQSSSGTLGLFDLVLQNLPLSSNTRSGRLADEKLLRHALQSLSPVGKAAILIPSTMLQHDHQDLWNTIFSHDWLEAVISLPQKLLHGTIAGACLLIFNKRKLAERLSNVLFIKSSSHAVPHARYNMLEDSDIQSIVQAIAQWGGDVHTVRVVPVAQIEEQNYNLNVDRYLEWVETPQSFSVGAALSRYHSAVKKREEAVERLIKTLNELNYPKTGSKGGKLGE